MTASLPPINTSANFLLLCLHSIFVLFYYIYSPCSLLFLFHFFFCIFLKIHKFKNCRRRLAGSGEYFPFLYLWWFDYIFLQDLQKGIQKNSKWKILVESIWVFREGFSSVTVNFVVHFWGMNILKKLKKINYFSHFNLFILLFILIYNKSLLSFFHLDIFYAYIIPVV